MKHEPLWRSEEEAYYPTEHAVMLAPARCTGPDLERWLGLEPSGSVLEAVLRNRLPAPALLDLLEESAVRGMGGAGYPTHLKWRALTSQKTQERVLVINGNEDEPGTFKDRILLERSPHQVLEGALLCAYTVGAGTVIVHHNPGSGPHSESAHRALNLAVEQWRRHPLLRRLEETTGRPLELRVHRARGEYVGGEETGLISELEGSEGRAHPFPFPHRKPPYPVEVGYRGLPTLVQNVETLAQVYQAFRLGPEAYGALGIGAARGTKLYCLSGDVLRPGAYELPLGTSLRTLVFEYGGGMLGQRPFKAVFTGGPTNTILTADELEVALDWDSLKEHHSRLGTGAMIVVSQGAGMVRRVAEYTEFFARSSCGQCPPCKLGTRQLSQLLRRLDTGRGEEVDLQRLRHLTQLLPGSGRCGLIDAACTVVASSLEKLEDDYRAAVEGPPGR